MGAYRDSQLGLCIDISGPDGNAFALMGHFKNYMKQLGNPKDEIDALLDEMRSSDYDNLVSVFERELGCVITLVGKG